MSPDWHHWTLTEASRHLRSRQVGAVELTRAVLDRISAIDGEVRAFVTLTADLALRQAHRAQATLDRDGEAAPALTGIPVALKDLIDVAGYPTTAGSRVLADNVPDRDAVAWQRLRRAGATLVGKVTTHEFAYGGTTEPTRNPWDLSRMIGGSSGGSGAALAAGMCFGALGSDTAGSIRIPAGFGGVVGLKPTRGRVSARGVIPLAPTLDCVGPMARTPMDVAVLFDALTGTTTTTTEADVSGLRVAVVRPKDPVEPDVRAAQDTAAAVLGAAGAKLEECPDDLDLAAAARVNFTIMAVEAARVHRRWLSTRAGLYSPYVRDRLLESSRTTAVDYLDAIEAARRIRRQWDAVLAGCDAALLTGMPCVAPTAYVEQVDVEGEAFDRDWLMCRDTAFANVTGHPALAVPTGLSGGLPVGVQLVAKHRREDLLFRLGQALHEQLAAPIP